MTVLDARYLRLMLRAEKCTNRYEAHELLREALAIEGDAEFINRITALYHR